MKLHGTIALLVIPMSPAPPGGGTCASVGSVLRGYQLAVPGGDRERRRSVWKQTDSWSMCSCGLGQKGVG